MQPTANVANAASQRMQPTANTVNASSQYMRLTANMNKAFLPRISKSSLSHSALIAALEPLGLYSARARSDALWFKLGVSGRFGMRILHHAIF